MVDCTGLENQRGGNLSVSSNLTPSAQVDWIQKNAYLLTDYVYRKTRFLMKILHVVHYLAMHTTSDRMRRYACMVTELGRKNVFLFIDSHTEVHDAVTLIGGWTEITIMLIKI